MRIFILTAIFIIPFSLFSRGGDVLVLKNEMIFKGTVKKIEKSAVRFKTSSGSYWVPSRFIYYVKLEKPENGILRDFFRKVEKDRSNNGKNLEDELETLIYKGFGIIGNDSYLKNVSLITPHDDDPGHRQITENYFSLGSKTYSDPIELKQYDKKAKLNFVRNTGIAIGSVLIMGIIENMLFVVE